MIFHVPYFFRMDRFVYISLFKWPSKNCVCKILKDEIKDF